MSLIRENPYYPWISPLAIAVTFPRTTTELHFQGIRYAGCEQVADGVLVRCLRHTIDSFSPCARISAPAAVVSSGATFAPRA